jgi:hypothetical protein
MKRVMKPIVSAFLIILGCVIFLSCHSNINSGADDILYNDIVYERTEVPNYNLEFTEDNAKYVGDFIETYDYGQELPWPVYALNSDENVLYSAHAVWVKPGYVFPKEFGEEFLSVDYVVTEGLDFLVIEDDYKETVTPLSTFTGSVKLEDIIASEPSDVTEFTEYAFIRLIYKNHANMRLYLKLCSSGGKYYLNVRQGENGTTALFEIKSEYVDLLTSQITQGQ